MASNYSLKPKMVNNQTKKVHNRKISKQMPVVGIYKKLLPMAYLKKD